MRIPARIAVPVGAAVAIVTVVSAVLFVQLEGTRALLSESLSKALGSGASMLSFGSDVPVPVLTGDEAMIHVRSGDMLALQGEWAAAAKEYEAAVQLRGGVTALRKLAQVRLQQRDRTGAEEMLERMRQNRARDEEILLLEARILLHSGEVVQARSILEAAEESPHKHYGLALLSIIGEEHEAAKAELTQVIGGWEPVLRSYAKTLSAAYEEYALFPESPPHHLHTLLAHSLAQTQECALALPLLSPVTHTHADYRDAWIVQGFCELSTGQLAEARASLEQAYQLDPEKPEIQYFLARAYSALEDHANALTYAQYAVRNGFKPEEDVRRLLAQEALHMNNASLALEQYEALTQLKNANLETFAAYITAAITADKKEEAYLHAQEAVGRWPQEAQAHDLLGWAAAETGRSEEAALALQKALELDPGLLEAKKRLEKL